MDLAPNTRLGRYEIRSRLGAGGMGEVYLARDPVLGRDVAIKVLPPRLSSEPQGLARFVREARAASALNHPNVITIFDVGEHAGTHLIVTELVDGLTLRDWVRGERPPLGELVSSRRSGTRLTRNSAALNLITRTGDAWRWAPPVTIRSAL